MAQSPVAIQQVWTEIIKEWDRPSAVRDIDALRLNLDGHGFRGTLRELRALHRRHGLDDSVLDMNLAIAGCWIQAKDESFAVPARRILQPIVDAVLSDEIVTAAEPTYQQILASVELQSVKDRAITELAIETLGPIMQRLPDMLFTKPDQIRDLVLLRGRLLDLTISDLFLTILSTAGTAPLRRMFTESLDHAVAAYQHVIRHTLHERMERLGVTTSPVEPPISTQPASNRDEKNALLTSDEAARRLGVSNTTLWRLVRDGAITKINIRGAVRYDPNDLDRYVGRS
jgi:excisionase family DNA binding protein